MRFEFIGKEKKKIWDDFVNDHPMSSCMQMYEWADARNAMGLKIYHRIGILDDNNKLILAASLIILSFGKLGRIIYVPFGPIWDEEKVLEFFKENIVIIAKKNNCFAVVLEPRITNKDVKNDMLIQAGFIKKNKNIQPKSTIIINLKKTQKKIFKNFRRSTQNYIKYSDKKGVVIKKFNKNSDFGELTSFYNQFRNKKSKEKYKKLDKYLKYVWQYFSEEGNATIWKSYYKNKPLSVLLIIHNKSWSGIIFKGELEEYKRLYANYILTWESLKFYKQRGCKIYDLMGAIKSEKNTALHLSTKEKTGFNRNVTFWSGTFELVLNPLKYHLWNILQNINILNFYGREYIKKY